MAHWLERDGIHSLLDAAAEIEIQDAGFGNPLAKGLALDVMDHGLGI